MDLTIYPAWNSSRGTDGMFRTLIVGMLILAGCAVRDPKLPLVLETIRAPQGLALVPDNKPSIEVQMVQDEIWSFYGWLLETRQLLVKPLYAKYPKEREVDPISHLPIPKPKLSDLEMREKLSELAKKTPAGETV